MHLKYGSQVNHGNTGQGHVTITFNFRPLYLAVEWVKLGRPLEIRKAYMDYASTIQLMTNYPQMERGQDLQFFKIVAYGIFFIFYDQSASWHL